MLRRRTTAYYLSIALSLLIIAGCGDSLSTGDATLPGDGTADIGSTARDEVEAALSALTLTSSISPIGTTPAAPAPPATGDFAPPCVTSTTPADSDGDGVPDDAVYLFVAPPCRFTGWRGGTLDVVGQLRIQDPAPTQAGFGYEGTLTGLRTRFTSSDNRLTDVTRNGTRALSGSISQLVLSTNLQLIRTFAGKPDAAVDQQWTTTYTPAAPLQINTPIPSGTLDIAGSLDWTRGTEHYVLTATTPTALHYNADCGDTVQRIDAGEMHLSGTFTDANGNDMKGRVQIRWNGCGNEPSFGFFLEQ
jgi:hypothetical protein